MKLFSFRGGVHPLERKEQTCNRPIEQFPQPQTLYVPLQQHLGEPAVPTVSVGDSVRRGQLLGQGAGRLSAPVHAPLDGIVEAIGDFASPHPAALPVMTVTLKVAADQSGWQRPAEDPFGLGSVELAERIQAAGIVGMGGATFPSAVKLDLARKHRVHTLIINGGECEPYLTCDDRLMRERASELLIGIELMLRCLQADSSYAEIQAVIVIEDNKAEALSVLRGLCRDQQRIRVVSAPTLYPQGSQKQMIKTVTGLEVPAGAHGTELGVVMHNVATAYAVYEALVLGKPLVSRIVTVGGGGVPRPSNLEVPFGTLASEVLEYCGVTQDSYERLLMGGPMMGQWLPHADVPVIKGSSGLIALTEQETRVNLPQPCIRCARCVEVCPAGLQPLELARCIRKNKYDEAAERGLGDCIACGSCAYVCPSKIPLVQYFHHGKGELAARRQQSSKLNRAAELSRAKEARLELETRLKAETAARLKAERDAKRAAEAALAESASKPASEEATP